MGMRVEFEIQMQYLFDREQYTYAFDPSLVEFPEDTLAHARIPQANEILVGANGIEAVAIGTEWGVVVPIASFRGMDPLVVAIKTKSDVVYTFSLESQLPDRNRVDGDGYLRILYEGIVLMQRKYLGFDPQHQFVERFTSKPTIIAEIGIPIDPTVHTAGISFKFGIKDIVGPPHDGTRGPALITKECGVGIIRYPTLPSILTIDPDVFVCLDTPHPIHEGYYRLPTARSELSFPQDHLVLEIEHVLLYDGRTVRRR